ncbi:MAG: class I SAM-dependent methyltransferase [Candidatus Giovannonibacteria bacterium]|nr:class I SAM-dependent methyltransferase [Candidatus Giovannonibacteria bacterium]
MAKWHFWGEKEFSDVYENIYIRALNEDWFEIVSIMVDEINSLKTQGKKSILDIGCGEGHTTKQILDRIKGAYACDLLEPNENALASAEAFLTPENNIGKRYPKSLATFKPEKKYDIVFTSHTNYYWALNQKDYNEQLKKLITFLKPNGKLLILTLPWESDHYQIALRQIYPVFNYAQYIIDFYKKFSVQIKVKKLRMRLFIGDILNTKKLFDVKIFYRFIHNTDSYPRESESRAFLKKIQKYQKNNYLDFKDYLIVVSRKE